MFTNKLPNMHVSRCIHVHVFAMLNYFDEVIYKDVRPVVTVATYLISAHWKACTLSIPVCYDV